MVNKRISTDELKAYKLHNRHIIKQRTHLGTYNKHMCDQDGGSSGCSRSKYQFPDKNRTFPEKKFSS